MPLDSFRRHLRFRSRHCNLTAEAQRTRRKPWMCLIGLARGRQIPGLSPVLAGLGEPLDLGPLRALCASAVEFLVSGKREGVPWRIELRA